MDPHFRPGQQAGASSEQLNQAQSTSSGVNQATSSSSSSSLSSSSFPSSSSSSSSSSSFNLLDQSYAVSLECLKSLLLDERTASVARNIISDSLSSQSPGVGGVETNFHSTTPASSHNSPTSSAQSFSSTGRQVIELNTLEGYSRYQASGVDQDGSNLTAIHQNSSSASSQPGGAHLQLLLDLVQLERRLPAIQTGNALEALNEHWQLFLVFVYSLTAITSFILNIITVIVLARCQRSELRKYLINLSLSDLLMSLFSIPFTYTEYMLGRWIFAAFLCPVIRFVVTLSVFVSVATMTVIGINRHLAIMYPLKFKNSRKIRQWSVRKTHVIIAVWLLGIGISLPEYLMFASKPFCYNNQLYYDCRNSWPESISSSYTVFLYLSTFVLPLALLSYLYTCIGLKLWDRKMPGNVDVNRDQTMQTKRAKVVKMLLVVVVFFAVFWLPLQTFSMVMFVYPEIRYDFQYKSIGYYFFIATYFICHWLSMSHSCLNPLIYCFMNKKFRTDLHNLICGIRRRSSRRAGTTGSGNPATGTGITGAGTTYETSLRGASTTTTRSFHYSLHNQRRQNSAHANNSSVRVKFWLTNGGDGGGGGGSSGACGLAPGTGTSIIGEDESANGCHAGVNNQINDSSEPDKMRDSQTSDATSAGDATTAREEGERLIGKLAGQNVNLQMVATLPELSEEDELDDEEEEEEEPEVAINTIRGQNSPRACRRVSSSGSANV